MNAPTVIPFPSKARPRSVDAPSLTWLERRYKAARFLKLAAERCSSVRWSGPPDQNSFYGPYEPIQLAYAAVGVDLPLFRGVLDGEGRVSPRLTNAETVAILFGEAFVAIPTASEMQTGDVVIYRDLSTPGEGSSWLGYLPMIALDAKNRVGVSASMRFGEVFETDWYRERRAMAWRLREELCAPTGPEAA
jgi:hypothetical protein